MVRALNIVEVDTICMIPPTHKQKVDITRELVLAARKAGGIGNGLLISSAGADLADERNTLRVREFVDIETLVMAGRVGTFAHCVWPTVKPRRSYGWLISISGSQGRVSMRRIF